MRRLLVVYGTALTSVVLVAFLVPLGLLARSLAHDRAVEAGRQEAQGLAVIVNTTGKARLAQAVEAVNAGPRRTTVYLPDGTTLGYPAPEGASVRLAADGTAFSATTSDGVEVLLPVGGPQGVTVIRTLVPQELVTEGVREAWLTLAVVGLLLLVVAVVVGDRIAARLSRSVRELADVAERVGSGELDATVTPAGPPEVASVGRVLNRLGARISAMLADERELSADLSHRLRTPVTALRLDVESLGDLDERERMTAHVDSLVAAVDAAVDAARNPEHVGSPGRCDAVAVVTERARFWSVLAEETARPLGVDVPTVGAPVPVSADDLGAALDALVDNVFSHTPARSGFRLTVASDPASGVAVAVDDDGPGLGNGLGTDLVSRRGVSGSGSTGIGLSVVRRTAEGAGGSLRLEDSTSGGARVVMVFPPQTLVQS